MKLRLDLPFSVTPKGEMGFKVSQHQRLDGRDGNYFLKSFESPAELADFINDMAE